MTAPGSGPSRRVVAVVSGLVQGVGYRWFVQREATNIGLEGWVSNQPDGSVEVVAEGSEEAIERLLGALRKGPPGASVSAVKERREPSRGNLAGFVIRSGGHRGD